jgi:hypothetical protein
MFVTNIILHIRDNRRNTREKEVMTKELTSLKATLFDYQEAEKKKSGV